MKPEIVVCGIPFETPREAEALRYVKEHGFTSVQIYVHWRLFEPEKRGEFDWSFYDREICALQQAGLKFVPFLPLGPKYTVPEWWLRDPNHRGLVCLEHGKESPVESIWNPAFRAEMERVMAAFAAHYGPWNVLESVQPGICGDYGEAIFPVLGNWPGDYHTHQGFWCGGEDAAASFRAAMQEKYGSIAELNRAWRAAYASFDEVRPFRRSRQPSRTAWLDMMDWYHGSMTEFSAFWMDLCRRNFPGLPVYLCTGGTEPPEHGAHFGEQAAVAARYGGGIRLTNEGNNFFQNLQDTIHMHSACEFYGAYLGLEPVGPMQVAGVVNRIYGSAAYGNRQIFHYYDNLVDEEKQYNGAAEEIRKYLPLIRERRTQAGITLFWPMDEAFLDGTRIPENLLLTLEALRKSYEVRVADERMILDGALEGTRLLVMLDAGCARAEALHKIADWVAGGGVLLCNRHVLNTELDPDPAFDAVFGIEGAEEAWGHTEYRAHPADWTAAFSQIDRVHSSVGWRDLAASCRPLLQCEESDPPDAGVIIRPCMAAFTHPFGKGLGIFYAAPLDLNTPEDAIMGRSPAFRYLLADCCRAYGGVEPMELAEGDIVRTRIDGRTLVLRDRQIEWLDN